MNYKIILLLVVSFFFQEVKSQVFKLDWSDFASDKYLIESNDTITTFYGTDSVGELHFILKSNTSKALIIFVFPRNKTMEEFDLLFSNETNRTSCVNVNNGSLSVLYYKEFVYLVSPWQPCYIANDSAFNTLSEELWQYIFRD